MTSEELASEETFQTSDNTSSEQFQFEDTTAAIYVLDKTLLSLAEKNKEFLTYAYMVLKLKHAIKSIGKDI